MILHIEILYFHNVLNSSVIYSFRQLLNTAEGRLYYDDKMRLKIDLQCQTILHVAREIYSNSIQFHGISGLLRYPVIDSSKFAFLIIYSGFP